MGKLVLHGDLESASKMIELLPYIRNSKGDKPYAMQAFGDKRIRFHVQTIMFVAFAGCLVAALLLLLYAYFRSISGNCQVFIKGVMLFIVNIVFLEFPALQVIISGKGSILF